MTETKNNWKTIGTTILHWLAADLWLSLSLFIQYLFIGNTGKSGYGGGIAPTQLYKINYPFFFIGVIMFIVGYYFAWKLFLKKDWLNLKDSHIGWKIGFSIVFLFNVFLLFVISMIITLFKIGLFVDISPVWADLDVTYFVFTAYMVILPIADLLVKKRLKINITVTDK